MSRDTDPSGTASASTYSKDYWDLVFEQLGRNGVFKAAFAVLVLLYATAIYAPLLANDRPYVLEAADYQSYGKALRTLYPAVLGMARIVRQTPEEYAAGRNEGVTQTFEEALASEVSAVETRLSTIRAAVGDSLHPPLTELEAAVRASAEAARSGDRDTARERIGEAKVLAKEIRKTHRALDPAHPEEGGIRLKTQRSYPLFEVISAGEVFFMVGWLFVLTWPLWNRFVNTRLLGGDRERIRAARKGKWGVSVGCAAVAAILWGATVGGESTFNVAPYKKALTSGDIAATRVIFPPVPYGFAETHGSEIFRPPTWVASAEISEEGYYVRGSRAPEPDPVTGFMPPPTPVEVRFGEPERNAPHRHLLGTDSVGRDFLTRLLWGGRVSLAVGLVSAVLLVAIGTVIGAVAGYFGGRVDLVISRFLEVVLCIPAFFLILMVSAFVDPNVIPPIISIVVIIALIRWTGVARLVRGEFLRLREMEFAVAARALGYSSARTIFRHLLPNAMAPALVAGAFAVASGILTESTLSYLGFGIQHPLPSWGSLINESKMAEHWWVQIFPGLLIFVTITCYNQVGDAFRDAVDPRMNVEG